MSLRYAQFALGILGLLTTPSLVIAAFFFNETAFYNISEGGILIYRIAFPIFLILSVILLERGVVGSRKA